VGPVSPEVQPRTKSLYESKAALAVNLASQDTTWPQQRLETGKRRLLMDDQNERAARFLVRVMNRATDGERRCGGCRPS
jgi:hypothetical protein